MTSVSRERRALQAIAALATRHTAKRHVLCSGRPHPFIGDEPRTISYPDPTGDTAVGNVMRRSS